MEKPDKYSINRIQITPHWKGKEYDFNKLSGKVALNNVNNEKVIELSLNDEQSRKVARFVIDLISETKNGDIIKSIKDKIEI
jgi:hypothetical protein